MLTRVINVIALILIIIGALTWGIIGIFNYNIIEHLFGHLILATRIVYILIGLAGLFKIYHIFNK